MGAENVLRMDASQKQRFPSEPVPTGVLSSSDPVTLNTWLSRYVVETRNEKGALYPPSTIYQLLIALLRHMRATNPDCPNFLEKKNSQFGTLHGTLDSHFRHLHKSGIGRIVKNAELISKADENKLWSSGVLGTSTPRSLFNTACFLLQWEEFLPERR